MKLDLISLEIENFKQFTHASIDFAARGPGLHFLRGRNDVEPRLGSNGAGKSSVWDALCWACHGKTTKGLPSTAVIPWDGEGVTRVRVTFAIDGEPAIIERTTNPNALRLDDKTCAQGDIDRLLGLNFDAFTATLLLGQGRPLFFDMTPAAKMELLSSVLDLDRWEARSDKARKTVLNMQRDMDELAGEMKGLYGEQDRLANVIKLNKKKADEWREEHDKRLDAMKADLSSLQKEFEEADKARGDADVAFDMAETELRAISTKKDQLNRLIGDTENALKQLIHLSEQSLETIKRTKLELKTIRTKKECPVCGGPMKQDHAHIRETEEQLATLERHYEQSAPAEKKLRKQLKELEDEFERLEQAQKDFTKKRNDADGRLRLATPRAHELEQRIAAIKMLRNERSDERNPFHETVRDLKRQMTQLDMRLNDLEKRARIGDRRIERTKFWVKEFKLVRLYLIEEVLQELELATNAMLEDVGLVGWEVHYDVEKETKSGTMKQGLTVSILSPHNTKAVRWESWSGGESQRLRLISALALSDVLLNNAGVDASFEILDEPTQHLSTEGVRDLVDHLDDRALSLGRQVWLTDHKAVESSRFASVLSIIKTPKGSVLDQDGEIASNRTMNAPVEGKRKATRVRGGE